MIKLMMPSLRCVKLLFLACASSLVNATFASSPLRGEPNIRRSLQAAQAAITTTSCNEIRTEDYEAELQLVYEYLVEFKEDSTRSLVGIERGITQAIAQELDACDALDRPVYKVKATSRHTFSKITDGKGSADCLSNIAGALKV